MYGIWCLYIVSLRFFFICSFSSHLCTSLIQRITIAFSFLCGNRETYAWWIHKASKFFLAFYINTVLYRILFLMWSVSFMYKFFFSFCLHTTGLKTRGFNFAKCHITKQAAQLIVFFFNSVSISFILIVLVYTVYVCSV